MSYSPAERERLVLDHVRLTTWAVGRFAPFLRGADRDDAIAEATVALVAAATRANPSQPFGPYASSTVRFAVMKWLDQRRRHWRDREAEPAAAIDGGEDLVDDRLDLVAVLRAFVGLTAQERRVMTLTLAGDTGKATARTLGVSGTRVYQLRKSAIAKLRKRFAGDAAAEDLDRRSDELQD